MMHRVRTLAGLSLLPLLATVACDFDEASTDDAIVSLLEGYAAEGAVELSSSGDADGVPAGVTAFAFHDPAAEAAFIAELEALGIEGSAPVELRDSQQQLYCRGGVRYYVYGDYLQWDFRTTNLYEGVKTGASVEGTVFDWQGNQMSCDESESNAHNSCHVWTHAWSGFNRAVGRHGCCRKLEGGEQGLLGELVGPSMACTTYFETDERYYAI